MLEKYERIVRTTIAEAQERHARLGWRTDWARVAAITEEELEAAFASDPDEAEVPQDRIVWAQTAGPDGRRLVTFGLAEEAIAFLAEQPRVGEVVEEALRLLRERQDSQRDGDPQQHTPQAAE